MITRLNRKRVPVILQMNRVECGPACLTMILNYHGSKVRLSECRERCNLGRAGVSAHTLAEVGRDYGFNVKAYTVDLLHLANIPLPAIMHWGNNHFVVLERWTSSEAIIVDPKSGRRRLTHETLATHFTGVVLTFTPSDSFQKVRGGISDTQRNYLKSILYATGVRYMLGQILVVSLLLQLFGLGFPLLTRAIIDQVIPLRLDSIMSLLGIGMLILTFSQATMSYLRSTLFIYLRTRLDAQMMSRFLQHVLALPFPFFQQRASGDLIMRLGSNGTIRETLTGQLLSAILDTLFVVLYLVIILTQSVTFGLLVLGLGLLQVLLLLATTPTMHRLAQQRLETQAQSQSYLVEALRGIATLKTSGAEAHAYQQWSHLFADQLRVALRQGHVSNAISTLLSTLRTMSPLILLWVGTHWVLANRMSLGTMLALNALASSFLAPLTSLASTGQQLQLITAHLDRIMDVLGSAPEQQNQAVTPKRPLQGAVQLDKVSFRYSQHAPFVLQNISVTIAAGEKVAIVGATGSGKSTLAMLLLGLYESTAGHIHYDGVSISCFDYASLRRQIGVVLQESFLFSTSIRDNISFYKPDLPLDKIVAAAQLAAIHQEISEMPLGYEMNVAEGGMVLSGGQRQRLSIARALASEPAILIFDEATSHLDAVTERLIEHNLDQLDCTRIVIAHRLSTIRNADQILVMRGGQIVERGKHSELLSRDGYYAHLVHSQLATSPIEANGNGAYMPSSSTLSEFV